MPQPITVEVTAGDIRHGHPCNTMKCPIATALSRAAGLPCSVGYFSLYIAHKRYNTPKEAKAFILAFDSVNNTQAHPFTFTLSDADAA